MKKRLKTYNRIENRKLSLDLLFSIFGAKLLEQLGKGDDHESLVYCALNNEGIRGISAFVERGNDLNVWENRIRFFLNRLFNISRLETPKIIIGQSGSGKESMAKALHYLKYFNIEEKTYGDDKKFHTFDASTVHPESINSELFGHVKGAFTGALEKRNGILKVAENQTLFIDELGKLPIDIQGKLLRVIEYKTFKKMGSDSDEYLENINFIISLQPSDIAQEKILLDLQNRLNLHNAIELPSLTVRMARDKGIVNDVFRKILRRSDIQDAIRVAGLNYNDKYEKYTSESAVKILQMVKSIKEYDKKRITLGREYVKFGISNDAYKHFVNYSGYENKNFRELNNILESALINAITHQRYMIETEDLDKSFIKNKIIEQEEEKIISSNYEDVVKVPLRDIIDYGEDIKNRIVHKKVEDVFRMGQDVKNVLMDEGISEKEYTNYYNKLKRIVGPLKQIRKQKKIQ